MNNIEYECFSISSYSQILDTIICDLFLVTDGSTNHGKVILRKGEEIVCSLFFKGEEWQEVFNDTVTLNISGMGYLYDNTHWHTINGVGPVDLCIFQLLNMKIDKNLGKGIATYKYLDINSNKWIKETNTPAAVLNIDDK